MSDDQERAARQAALREYQDNNVPAGYGPSFAAGWAAGRAYERQQATERAETANLRETITQLENRGDGMAMHLHGWLLCGAKEWCEQACEHVPCWMRRSLVSWRNYRGHTVSPALGSTGTPIQRGPARRRGGKQ